MPPRALAVTLPTALAAWLAIFLAGCSPAAPPDRGDISGVRTPPPGAVGLRYVTHRVQPANDFKRISEYFTGDENTGGDVVLRTDSGDRRGLYFMIATDHLDKLPDGAVAVLEFVSAEKSEASKHFFIIPPMSGAGIFKEMRLGVTGKDWPESDPKVIAWKITLRDKKTGTALASDQSFLWSLPAQK